VQGTGKEQKTEHAVQQCLVEINALDQLQGFLLIANVKDAEKNHAERPEQGDGHDAYGGRQFNEPVVYIAEQGGKSNKGGKDIEKFHEDWLTRENTQSTMMFNASAQPQQPSTTARAVLWHYLVPGLLGNMSCFSRPGDYD